MLTGYLSCLFPCFPGCAILCYWSITRPQRRNSAPLERWSPIRGFGVRDIHNRIPSCILIDYMHSDLSLILAHHYGLSHI
jgi:hypothetical protein